MVVSWRLKPHYLFGKDAIFELKNVLANHSYQKALILYGKGSIKTNGIYDQLVSVLKSLKLPYVEFSGIEANPKSDTLDRCVSFAKHHLVDIIFAPGGGSVVDSAKVIAALITNHNYKDSWQFTLDQKQVGVKNKPIDIVSIITTAGTGSENNAGAVVSNPKTKEKKGVQVKGGTPMISVQDPSYTFSVNAWHTASGIFDCFSHLLEQYFGKSTFFWTQEYLFANLKVLVNYAKKVLVEPNHYDARANIFWTTSMSLNGLASFNCSTDWSVHAIEHAFSGLYDITHGAGLAFVTPTYLKLRALHDQWFHDKVILFGKAVFKTRTLNDTLKALTDFIVSINLPTKWSQFSEIEHFNNEDKTFLLNHVKKYSYSELTDFTLYAHVLDRLQTLK